MADGATSFQVFSKKPATVIDLDADGFEVSGPFMLFYTEFGGRRDSIKWFLKSLVTRVARDGRTIYLNDQA